jgi:hypothetical protein
MYSITGFDRPLGFQDVSPGLQQSPHEGCKVVCLDIYMGLGNLNWVRKYKWG